jgi:biotin carboxyl carrier protein
MKRYHITLEGQTFDVKVLDDPRRNQVRVEVDGETFTVGVDGVPVVADVGRASAEVASGDVVQAAAPARLPKSSETSEVSGDPPEAGTGVVVAPLPGVIKSIAVRQGQAVAANDEFLVIEAMKMDNVIRATCGGTVGIIHVTEGCQVAYGEPLLEISADRSQRGRAGARRSH